MEAYNPQSLEPREGPGAQPDLREILRRLWGYKWLLLAVMFLVVGVAWIALQQVTPRYTATATIMIEPPENNVIDIAAVVEGLDTTPQTIRGELLVLESRELAAKAVEEMGLADSARFTAPAKNGSFLAHLNPVNYLPADWRTGIGDFFGDAKASVMGRAPTPNTPEENPEERRRRAAVDRLLAGLSLKREPYTRVVRVSFTLEDPTLAAKAANTLAEVYVRNTLEVKYAGTREAARWLSGQLEGLREKLDESELAAERIRQGDALVQGRSAQLVAEQISAINIRLVEARAEAARQKARLQRIEKLKKSPDWEDQSTSLVGSDLIQALRLEQFKLERETAELSTEYGEKHPKMINIRAEIADVQNRISREIDKIVAAVRSDLVAAVARKETLQRDLDGLTNEVGGLNAAEMRLRTLEREADSNRLLYDTFLTRYKETSVQEEVQQPDARVISYAAVPGGPSYPRENKILYGALVLAIGMGLALVYLIEALDKGFRTARQLEELSGVPVFGLVPSVPLGRGKAARPEDYIFQEPNSRYAEAVNLLYSNSKWPGESGSAKTVLISSALPKEGKTSTAVSLARRAALIGEKALLVDCDFRRPQASRQLGLKLSPGLAEVLSGDVTLEEAIQEDAPTGAKFLACGRGIADPVALLRSGAFQQILEPLKERFTYIVLDSSPILAVAEAQIFARIVDQNFVLVRWGKTPRQAALAAVKQLQDFGVQVDGVVLTQVNASKQSYYGYGEYGYYTSRMKGYYSH